MSKKSVLSLTCDAKNCDEAITVPVDGNSKTAINRAAATAQDKGWATGLPANGGSTLLDFGPLHAGVN